MICVPVNYTFQYTLSGAMINVLSKDVLKFKQKHCFNLTSIVLQLALNGGAGHPSCSLLPPLCLHKLPTVLFPDIKPYVLVSFMKIGPKFKKLSMFKGQFYMYSISEVFFCGMELYFITCLETKHIT